MPSQLPPAVPFVPASSSRTRPLPQGEQICAGHRTSQKDSFLEALAVFTSENAHLADVKPQLNTSENRHPLVLGGWGHAWEEDAKFPHWAGQANFCDTREVVLERDGQDVQRDEQCRAVEGTWYSGSGVDTGEVAYSTVANCRSRRA
jgi:hypothetical protein